MLSPKNRRELNLDFGHSFKVITNFGYQIQQKTEEIFDSIKTSDSYKQKYFLFGNTKEKIGDYFSLVGGKYALLEHLNYSYYCEVYKCYDVEELAAKKNNIFSQKKSTVYVIKFPTEEYLYTVYERAKYDIDTLNVYIDSVFTNELLCAKECKNSIKIISKGSQAARWRGKKGVDKIYIPFLVFEYCQGGNLTERMQKKYVGSDICNWGKQIASFLNSAHRKEPPILHLDLKPDNILVEKEQLKICDFGSSRINYEYRKTLLGMRGHTAEYCAPEVLHNKFYPESDMWSFGIILFQLITKKMPCEASRGPKSIILRDEDIKVKVARPIINLVNKLLVYEHSERSSASNALRVFEDQERGTEEIPLFDQYDKIIDEIEKMDTPYPVLQPAVEPQSNPTSQPKSKISPNIAPPTEQNLQKSKFNAIAILALFSTGTIIFILLSFFSNSSFTQIDAEEYCFRAENLLSNASEVGTDELLHAIKNLESLNEEVTVNENLKKYQDRLNYLISLLYLNMSIKISRYDEAKDYHTKAIAYLSKTQKTLAYEIAKYDLIYYGSVLSITKKRHGFKELLSKLQVDVYPLVKEKETFDSYYRYLDKLLLLCRYYEKVNLVKLIETEINKVKITQQKMQRLKIDFTIQNIE